MEKPIYPKIDIRESEKQIVFTTFLRKNHNGKWYLWKFYEKYIAAADTEATEESKRRLINRFHQTVYYIAIVGRISTELKDADGFPIFELDEDQTSEEERIKKLLQFPGRI